MNPFAVVGVEPCLALNESVVAGRVRELLKETHPDHGGGEETFTEVRKAGDILKSPLLRLKSALGLVGIDEVPRGEIANEIMNFFGPVADALAEVDCFVSERAKALSALGKAMIDAKIPSLKKKLEVLVAELADLEIELVAKFADFDELGWEMAVEEMLATARSLAFLGNWQGQLRAANGKIFEALLAGA